ncbi:MAG: ATP-binding protein [Deltaproteobacteria bacterium]|nr:ATP-binding protein [Deltaproteobacteria bacterium]
MDLPLRRLAISDSAFAAAGRDRVHTGAVGSEPWSLEVTDLHAMNLLSTELWIVSGTNTSLSRYSVFQATPIAVPVLLPAQRAGAQLVAAPGDQVSMWNASDVVEIDGRSAKTTTTPLPARTSLAVPLRAGRWVVAHERSVQLVDRTVLWESRTIRDTAQPVVDGSSLLGGRLVALVLGRNLQRTIVVLDAPTGKVLHRYPLQSLADARFASKQQLAALRSPNGDVIVLNLMTGRTRAFPGAGEHILDAAISPSGRWLAVLDSVDGRLVVRGCALEDARPSWWTVELDEAAPDRPAPPAPVEAPAIAPPAPVQELVITRAPSRRAGVRRRRGARRGKPARAALRPRSSRRCARAARPEPSRARRTLLELQLPLGRELVRARARRGVRQRARAGPARARGRVRPPPPGRSGADRRARPGRAPPRRRCDARAAARPQGARRPARPARRHRPRARAVAARRRHPARRRGARPVGRARRRLRDDRRSQPLRVLRAAGLQDPRLPAEHAPRDRVRARAVVAARALGPGDRRRRPAPPVRVADRTRSSSTGCARSPSRPTPTRGRGRAWRRATCRTSSRAAGHDRGPAGSRAASATSRCAWSCAAARDSGRRTALAALAALAGRILGDIDAAALAGEGRATAEHLARELRRARIRGWFPCVSDPGVAVDDETERRHIRRVLDEYPGPLALRMDPDAAPPLAPGYTLVDLPNLSEAERLAHWRTVTSAVGYTVRDVEALSARYRIGPGVITHVATGVAPRPEPVDAELGAAIVQHLDDSLGDVAQRVKHLATWSSLILVPDVEDSLRELISRMRWSRLVFEQWGFGHSAGGARGIVSLFHGVPGTGKTMAAGAIARELGVDLYRIDLSRVVSKWIGETERNLANVFRAAEESQAIVLFDEADSLFAKRTEVRSSVDRYANLEVNYILQRLDTFEGIAILTSNHLSAIDPAFRRRLTVEVNFPFPDEDTREHLWRVHLPADLRDRDDLDLRDIARRYQLSGGYIRNAALRAAFLAAEEGVRPSREHIERAVRLQYTQAGKFSSGGALE